MKNISVFITGLSLLLFCVTGLCIGATDHPTGGQTNGSAVHSLTIVSSPELAGLTGNWALEYKKVNPSMTIIQGMIGEDQGKANLGFVTSENAEATPEGRGWKMVVGRDAIVAVINARNPMLDEINRQGLSSEEIALLFTRPEMRNWKNLIVGGKDLPVNYYMIDNEKVNAIIGSFTGIDNAALNGTKVATSAALISAIQKDVNAIGFCRLTDVRDATTNEIQQNMKLLPIDKNRNGRIDNFENIYSSLDAFTRGVWIGKYPTALCGNIYATAFSKPTDQHAVAFLSWIITDGQQYLNQNGYSDLASVDVKSGMNALTGVETIGNVESTKPFLSRTWLAILITLGLIGLTAGVLIRNIIKLQPSVSNEAIDMTMVLNENTIKAPKGLYFDKSHTWAFMEEDGNVKVGVDDFLQHITGTLTRITMKAPGEKVRKGEKILTIARDGKQLNIYAPISGMIKEQNKSLLTHSWLINSSPFNEGWVYLIEPKNWVREIQFLFMVEKYKEWLNDEFARLKDFFAASARSNKMVYAHIVLQDGGELTDHVLADMGPEVWEDFQSGFIDTSR